MSWLLRVEDTLYLMQGGTNQYTDKVQIDVDSFADLKWFVTQAASWLALEKPGTMQLGSAHPAKYSEQTKPKPPGTSEPFKKPAVTRVTTPNQSSRNGAPINSIVLHYTTSSSAEGTISWFANPDSRVSSHYLVGRDGKIWQFVNDANKAWHAAGANANTLGIENVCADGQTITTEQSVALAALCKYLMSEYKIPKSEVTGHRFLGQSTSCPGTLFGEPTEAAMQKWIDSNLG